MSGNETVEGIRPEVSKDSADAVFTEPKDSASKSTSLDEMEQVETATTSETAVASAVDEASVSQLTENSRTAQNPDALDFTSLFKSNIMKCSNLHCPFVWQKDLDIFSYQDHELDLLSSTEEMFDDSGFRFRSYIVNLVLSYHNFYKRNIEGCMQHLNELDKMMMQTSKKESRDYLFNTINDALYHVIHSCRIYILQTTEQTEKAEQILSKITSYDAMSNANKAGLWAIRANVYVEYGYEGVKNAISYIRKATNLDPDNAFWHFMKGMFIGRLRRMEGGLRMPENEEFEALRIAVEKREDSAFIAFTGETYMETAKTAKKLLSKNKIDKNSEKQAASYLQDLNEVAAKYFKESIALKPNSSHLLFRCGKGLINLPPPHQDIQMGKDLIKKGLEISPESGYGNHAMAMYVDKIEKNPSLAKEYLSISIEKKNFPAHVDRIRIEFQETKNAKKLWEDLEEMLKLYTEMPRKRKILGEMVCYHLFIVYDLVEACFYMKKLIQLNSTSVDVINKHRSMALPIYDPIPLCDLIFNRINASLKDRNLSELCRTVLTKYIQFIIDENIEPQQISDKIFNKFDEQIATGYKNKQIKSVNEAQKRVRSAHEFGADPCAKEELTYLNFYKNDLKDSKIGKTRSDMMTDVLHKMRQNPLPKRRLDEDLSDGDGRREDKCYREQRNNEKRHSRRPSTESSRSSRKHPRHRSCSSSSSSSQSYSSSSDDRRNSHMLYQSWRESRRRSPSSSSSYSSSSNTSSDSSSNSADRYRKLARSCKDYCHWSSSYERKHSHKKYHCRDQSPKAKSRHPKKNKHDRSFSSNTSFESKTSTSSRSDSTLCQKSRKKVECKKPVNVPTSAEVATNVIHSVEETPKTEVDYAQVILDNLTIEQPKSSRKSSPQPTTAGASKNAPNVVGTENSNQKGDAQAESSQSVKKSNRYRENREDSDGSVKTTTSRTSAASKRSSKRRSRDRSFESVRTNSSRSSKRESKSSTKRRSSRSSSEDRSSERSSSRHPKRSEHRRSNSPDLIRRTDSATNRSDKRLKDQGTKNRDRKHSPKPRRRREDTSESSAESSRSSRRNHSDENTKGDRRSQPKDSKHSKDEQRRRRHKGNDEKDRSSKTESSQSSD